MNTAPHEEDPDILIGRCYTYARRFPLVMGRLPGGGRLWGGPYTIPQAIVIVTTAILLITTQDVWARFGVLGNVAIAVGLPFGLGLVVRRMRIDGRHPFAVLTSMLGLIGAPSAGRIGGRPLRALPGARPLVGLCTVSWHPAEPATAAPKPTRAAAPATARTPDALSAAGSLLAARTKKGA
ncbi:hypothetical protein KQH21_11915 [Streptomyces sp. IpFD-1.1]|uniref:hypothetical protein n=1 Tax=Streptomyces sp. IpFD-1.1 TaxID=2841664 RepID=UPI0020957E83|nr:hypothetical protein [Streptomyces sp. IpFD-1.1]MCO6748869.1 hypothetical protein [Streptomyces sp. IpFD-1.1]